MNVNLVLLAFVWLVNAAAAGLHVAFFVAAHRHPMTPDEEPSALAVKVTLLVLPYVLAVFAAYWVRRSRYALLALGVGGLLFGGVSVASHYIGFQFGQRVMDARAQGQHGPMSCGPPVDLCYWAFAYIGNVSWTTWTAFIGTGPTVSDPGEPGA